MRVAFYQADITPPPGEEMGGYGYYINRRSTGVSDPLRVRVCAFRDSDCREAVLIQADLVGLQADHVAEIRSLLSDQCALPPEAFFLHCTHTHTGPSSMSFFGPGTLTEWLRGYLSKAFGDAVRAASQGPWFDVTACRWFEEPCPGIAFNRDSATAPADPLLRGLCLEFRDASPVLLASFGCHPVVYGCRSLYSADYPGAFAQEMAAVGYRTLFLTAPCGDIDPLINRAGWGTGTTRTLEDYGQRLRDAALRGLASAPARTPVDRVLCRSAEVYLEVTPPTPEDCRVALHKAEKALAADPTDGLARSQRNGRLNWLRMLAAGEGSPLPIEVQGLLVGDVCIAGVGAELFTELASAIRGNAGFDHLLLAGTSNGVRCYVSTPDAVRRGAYSAESACFYGVFPQSAGAGERFALESAAFLRDEIRTD